MSNLQDKIYSFPDNNVHISKEELDTINDMGIKGSRYYSNALLENQTEQIDDLYDELKLSNEKVDFLKEQLETSNNRIGELQSHLEKEREERLDGEQKNKTSSIIDRSIAIISVLVAIFTWFFK